MQRENKALLFDFYNIYTSGQLSIWNRKTLAQYEYHIYRQIPLHTHDYLTKIQFETLVWGLMKRGRGFESHSGQLSIWNRKTLAQYEYHMYIYIYIYIYINEKN